MENITGKIIEAYPGIQFDVESEKGVQRCYTSGKMIKNRIKIIIGDTVEYELQEGSRLGRIIKRK